MDPHPLWYTQIQFNAPRPVPIVKLARDIPDRPGCYVFTSDDGPLRPGEVLYVPKFTYIWQLAEGRFPEQLRTKVSRKKALTEIARAYLRGAGQTARGELSRVTGLSRADAGKGNHALVAEGAAERLATGVYRYAGDRGPGAGDR